MFYHGTEQQFGRFDLDYAVEGGFFFTNDFTHASRFGSTVLCADLAVANPFHVDGASIPEDHEMEDIEALVGHAKSEGCDAVYIKGFRDAGRTQDTVIVFDPANISILSSDYHGEARQCCISDQRTRRAEVRPPDESD